MFISNIYKSIVSIFYELLSCIDMTFIIPSYVAKNRRSV